MKTGLTVLVALALLIPGEYTHSYQGSHFDTTTRQPIRQAQKREQRRSTSRVVITPKAQNIDMGNDASSVPLEELSEKKKLALAWVTHFMRFVFEEKDEKKLQKLIVRGQGQHVMFLRRALLKEPRSTELTINAKEIRDMFFGMIPEGGSIKITPMVTRSHAAIIRDSLRQSRNSFSSSIERKPEFKEIIHNGRGTEGPGFMIEIFDRSGKLVKKGSQEDITYTSEKHFFPMLLLTLSEMEKEKVKEVRDKFIKEQLDLK